MERGNGGSNSHPTGQETPRAPHPTWTSIIKMSHDQKEYWDTSWEDLLCAPCSVKRGIPSISPSENADARWRVYGLVVSIFPLRTGGMEWTCEADGVLAQLVGQYRSTGDHQFLIMQHLWNWYGRSLAWSIKYGYKHCVCLNPNDGIYTDY